MSIESAPTRYAWLSIAAALATITLKTGAYWLSGSVGLLSDALESIVNLVAAVMALMMLRLAALPPDEDHAYGHSKAEYFADGRQRNIRLCCAHKRDPRRGAGQPAVTSSTPSPLQPG